MGLGTKARNLALRIFLRGLINDVKKGEYGMGAQAIWRALDGKKTWLGLLAAFLPQAVDLVAKVIVAGGGSADQFVRIGGSAMVIVGAAHKLLKGE